MDIQGYILDHWLAKMKVETPVLMIYDKDGLYYDLLPLAEEKGIKVIDTTKGFLHARLSASRYWCNELSLDKDTRMIIYRHREMPRDNRKWVEEPYAGFRMGASLFPYGPQDDYKNICRTFLPTKQKELDNLFDTGSTSFNMINALLDGAAYPELEQLTGGKSFAEMTIGLLSKESCSDMKWLKEWKSFATVHYPDLDATGLTLKEVQTKLWTYLLFSEFVFDLPEKLPDNFKSVAIAPVEMKDKVYMVCDKLRNQIDLRETYVRIANKIAEQLNLADIFSKARHLGERVTFSFENSVEYERLINYLKEGKIDEGRVLYKKNINDVWSQEDSDVAAFWHLTEYVLILMECVNQGIKDDYTLSEFIKWYAERGCEADYAFRKYHTELLGFVSTPKQVKGLTDIFNRCYRDFVEHGVNVYQKSIRQLKKTPDLKNQGCMQVVYPALENGKRVVFVMVDAFRYEMGKTFAESIEKSFRGRVEYTPRISYLPSITRFGMANHLGNITLAIQSGKLQPVIEGASISTPEDRVAYLKHKTGLEIQDFRLEDFDPTAINENTRLLVIRSVGIDTAGENDKLNGLSTMEREMIRLARLTDDCKRLKFDLAVFVADHGFMLQPSFRVSDQIDKPVGSGIIIDESRLLAGSINESKDTISFIPKDLDAKIPVLKLCYAKNFTVFTRGEVYYHEGLSLQENVVPIISVKLQEEKERQIFKISLSYKDKFDGTVYSRRPVIDINTSFADLFAEDINIRIRVTGDNGDIIGKPEGKFYNDVTELLDIPSGATKIRQPISINDDYKGKEITVTAFDVETNATLTVLKLNFEND
jgi:hypothetical protein